MFQQWMQEIQTDARSGKLSTVLESHLLEMPKTVASLALIFELVEGGRAEVGPDAMALALGWADFCAVMRTGFIRRVARLFLKTAHGS